MAAALLDEPRIVARDNNPATNLLDNMAAVRVSFCWLGSRKSLTPEQRAEAAQSFEDEGQYLSAGMILLNVSQPAIRYLCLIN